MRQLASLISKGRRFCDQNDCTKSKRLATPAIEQRFFAGDNWSALRVDLRYQAARHSERSPQSEVWFSIALFAMNLSSLMPEQGTRGRVYPAEYNVQAQWQDNGRPRFLRQRKQKADPTRKKMPTRDDAWKLLCEYTQSESLRKHMLAVEACVRAYARKNGADENLWGIAALLHDFDYERWPNNDHSPDREHPAEGARILREHGYDEELIRAILSHAEYSGVPRQSALEHTLFACDELAGFLTACAYVRPSKSILDLEVSSVKKRMKDKAFARGVNREDVIKGAEELGVPLDEHIAFCIAAMREQADALGLRGTL
jgi:putative nucleotidyltransferase with HDIG domain